MKILALTLFIMLGILTVFPAYKQQVSISNSCCETKCSRAIKEKPVKKDPCQKKGCNPFMSCIYGNFFFNTSSLYSLFISRPLNEKTFVTNDNRIVNAVTDCFHPPNKGSV